MAAIETDSSLLPGTDISTGKRSNALSNRLTTVLSSSYTDPGTRHALRLLDARRLQNDEQLRRHLKSDAQEEVIASNAKIVDDFGHVAELKRVGTLIQTLNKTCDDMQKHVLKAKQESAPVLDEAATLIARQKEVEAKQLLLTAFKDHFIIPDGDLTLLTSSAEPVNDQYFKVLHRVQQIHKDCEILLGYENQRLGLELMEQTTRNLDAGFKKLYNWVQREFKTLDLEDPHINGSIRRALRVLSERPTLFQNCLDLFAEARQTTLAEAFQLALTGNSNDTTKAIDFSAHDPLRYVGDMLAWIHSTAVSERESLEGLFIGDASEISSSFAANEPWARPIDSITEMFDGHRALNSLISRSLTDVCQSLNARVHHSTRSIGDPVLIYKIYNLLTFYSSMFIKLFNLSAKPTSTTTPAASTPNAETTTTDSSPDDPNILFSTLLSLSHSTHRHFQITIEDDLSHLLSSPNPPTASLSPPPFLTTTLTQFIQILTIRSTNLTPSEFTQLFETMLNPVLNACADVASSIHSPQKATIYRLNYIGLVQTQLAGIPQSAPANEAVDSAIEKAERELTALEGLLVDEITAAWLEGSGVSDLLSALTSFRRQQQRQDTDDDEAKHTRVKHEALLNKLELETAAGKLDDFLSSGLADAEEQLSTIQDRKLAKGVVGQSVERFVEGFEEVRAVLDGEDERVLAEVGEGDEAEEGQGGGVRLFADLYPRTVGEVRALLS